MMTLAIALCALVAICALGFCLHLRLELDDLSDRVQELEKWAHPPAHLPIDSMLERIAALESTLGSGETAGALKDRGFE